MLSKPYGSQPSPWPHTGAIETSPWYVKALGIPLHYRDGCAPRPAPSGEPNGDCCPIVQMGNDAGEPRALRSVRQSAWELLPDDPVGEVAGRNRSGSNWQCKSVPQGTGECAGSGQAETPKRGFVPMEENSIYSSWQEGDSGETPGQPHTHPNSGL